MDYGSSVYGSAPKNSLAKDLYNQGLRICLRALRTSPINALEIEAGCMPLEIRRQWIAEKEILKSVLVKLPIYDAFSISILDRLKERRRISRSLNMLALDWKKLSNQLDS